MIMSDINTDYFSDKGHSYGGKYILYTKFKRDDVDRELRDNDI